MRENYKPNDETAVAFGTKVCSMQAMIFISINTNTTINNANPVGGVCVLR
jgi:hypothetical protein